MVPGLVGKWFGISRVELGGTAMDVVRDCAHGAVVHARPFDLEGSGSRCDTDLLQRDGHCYTHDITEGWDWFEPSIAWNGWPWISLGPANMGFGYYWDFFTRMFATFRT